MKEAPLSGGPDRELRLVPGVSCARGDGEIRVATRRRNASLGADAPWKGKMLARLAHGASRPSDLVADAAQDAEPVEVEALIAQLEAGGWLAVAVRYGGRTLYTLLPESPLGTAPGSGGGGDGAVLSRFTVVRRERDGLVAESPLASARLETHDPAVRAAVGVLAGAGGAAELAAVAPAAAARERLVADLLRSGLAVSSAEEEGAQLRLGQWQPHELWFHRRSRMGDRSDAAEGYGRTMWARGSHDPLPGRREPYPGPEVALHRPSLEALRRADPTLTSVVEDRRSLRVHDDDNPITADQLGELLYRCARVRSERAGDGVEYLSRPHPSGGSVYELELYPVVRLASGLDAGMYHYDAHAHRLRLVQEAGPDVRRLMRTALRAAPTPGTPQVLIVVTARFGRLMWIYEQMPYSLILKHVGVLYQTMYLVATAMGLAACGLGGGDATDFNAATGTDYATESAVGEFSLGSRPPLE
ncbi:SagB family peptide dehydrogenase [Streptomonospora wellingtoniae]|uniref:SagB family peptide dehydrogenase n=1 Tax=Streptomonospora wellingtoniae TaxID=3075544 RepID=A0ABU2L046_9ACTN|nr:SagB family peptide dehydrogenase [Streptomonospora sp. DSM 45055]MDT0304937.1 SagB family peptide dehydrogenase [Streptomonospora sp. DSM 45055]